MNDEEIKEVFAELDKKAEEAADYIGRGLVTLSKVCEVFLMDMSSKFVLAGIFDLTLAVDATRYLACKINLILSERRIAWEKSQDG